MINRGILSLLLCFVFVSVANSFALPRRGAVLSTETMKKNPSQSHVSKRTITHHYYDDILKRTLSSLQYNNNRYITLSSSNNSNENGEDKFSFFQRIESTKTAVLGLLSGGILSTPFIALHDIPAYGAPSWEFDTDMGSLQSALFAIVYRYCIREDDDNEMLNQGVVGAFVVTRTLSRVRVPLYCSAAPLDCGDPLGYLDYDMLQQLVLNGLESVALFGGAALAMEYAYSNKWISKFPN